MGKLRSCWWHATSSGAGYRKPGRTAAVSERRTRSRDCHLPLDCQPKDDSRPRSKSRDRYTPKQLRRPSSRTKFHPGPRSPGRFLAIQRESIRHRRCPRNACSFRLAPELEGQFVNSRVPHAPVFCVGSSSPRQGTFSTVPQSRPKNRHPACPDPRGEPTRALCERCEPARLWRGTCFSLRLRGSEVSSDSVRQPDLPGLNAQDVHFVLGSPALTDGARPSRDVKTIIARSMDERIQNYSKGGPHDSNRCYTTSR